MFEKQCGDGIRHSMAQQAGRILEHVSNVMIQGNIQGHVRAAEWCWKLHVSAMH